MAGLTFGRYSAIAELGQGGMADVFLAVALGSAKTGFTKLAVVKRLRQQLAEEPEFVQMFMDEARIAARLSHPNVVQTFDIIEEGDQHFIAMEFLDGQPLHRIQHRSAERRKHGEQGLDDVLQYTAIADALAGLHHAHEATDFDGTPLGIVHRDVTPHNLFVTYDGQAKVVDFGVAKAAGRSSATSQGVMKGKVRYMAPEQAMGTPVDRRADLFSMGVVLWEVAAGRRMWKDAENMEILEGLLLGDIPISPKLVNPEVPDEIDAICKKALAMSRDERFATADEFRIALENYIVTVMPLADARRQLAERVSALFEDKRVQIKAIIETQVTALRAEKDSVVVSITNLSEPSQPSGSADAPASAATDVPHVIAPDATALAPAPARPRRNTVAIVVLSAVAVLLIALLVQRTSSSHAGAVTPAAAESAASEPRDPSKGAAPTGDVAVKLTASPPEANITLDGRPYGAAMSERLPRDETAHTVVVSAPGYAQREDTLWLSHDVVREYALVRLDSSTAAPAQSGPRPVPPRKHPAAAAPKPPPPIVTATASPPPVVTAPPVVTTPTASAKKKGDKDIDRSSPWVN